MNPMESPRVGSLAPLLLLLSLAIHGCSSEDIVASGHGGSAGTSAPSSGSTVGSGGSTSSSSTSSGGATSSGGSMGSSGAGSGCSGGSGGTSSDGDGSV